MELFPAKERPNRRNLPFKLVRAPYKIIRYVLELTTDADAETVRRHLRSNRSAHSSDAASLQGPPYPFGGSRTTER